MRCIKALKLAPSEFKRMYGVTVERFWEMVKAVRDGKLGSRGSHASLPILDQILLTYSTGESTEHTFILPKTGECMSQQHRGQ